MSSLRKAIMQLDKNINELGTVIVNSNNSQEIKNIYLCYAEVLSSIEELKIEFDFGLKSQKEEFINYLKETKKKADEIYKKEVWYSLYYYIKDRS